MPKWLSTSKTDQFPNCPLIEHRATGAPYTKSNEPNHPMNEYTFWNPTTGEEIDIDAYGFEEASYLLYADDELNHNEWELHSVNGMM